jgi:hypothetical protein
MNTKNILIIGMAFSSEAILFAVVTAITTIVFVSGGGFNVSQAQEEGQQQQTPLSPIPPFAPPLTSPPRSPSTTISPELKAKMCDPSNPKLKFVNATESEVCGLPKSIKNFTTAALLTTIKNPPTAALPTTPEPVSPSEPPSEPRPCVNICR